MSIVDDTRRILLRSLLFRLEKISSDIETNFENIDSEKLICYSKELTEVLELFKSISGAFSLLEQRDL